MPQVVDATEGLERDTPFACGLCGSSESAPVWHRGHPGMALRTLVCTSCGLVQTHPRPTKDQLKRFYEQEYRRLYQGSAIPPASSRRNMYKQASSRYADLAIHLKAGSVVLEAGAATGEFLNVLKQNSHYPIGIELSPHCVAEARKVCKNVYMGSLEDQDFGEATVDAICLFHILEHLESPLDSLRQIRRWLRPAGILFVEVPDVRQPYWGNLSRFFQVAHLYSFSEHTLAACLGRAGFMVTWRRRFIEGKFLRMIARKSAPDTAVLGSLPIEGWKDVQTHLSRWRIRWCLFFKWKTFLDRLFSAIRRRVLL